MADSTPLSVHAPTGTPKGAVIVIQEAFGVNDHIEDVCRRFAEEGWLAVAPHLFHRTGDPKLGYDDFSVIMPHMQGLTKDGVLADVDAAIAEVALHGIPASKTGIVGFCMGGTVAFLAATRYPLGAAVTFYGGGIASGRFGTPSQIELAPDLVAPWLGLYGDRDQGIPVDEVEALREAAAKASVPTEVVRYQEAEHGFHCDARSSFHPPSSQDAWQRTLAWFQSYLS